MCVRSQRMSFFAIMIDLQRSLPNGFLIVSSKSLIILRESVKVPIILRFSNNEPSILVYISHVYNKMFELQKYTGPKYIFVKNT